MSKAYGREATHTMATQSSKANDPAEAALSAVEEALFDLGTTSLRDDDAADTRSAAVDETAETPAEDTSSLDVDGETESAAPVVANDGLEGDAAPLPALSPFATAMAASALPDRCVLSASPSPASSMWRGRKMRKVVPSPILLSTVT